MSYSTIYNFLPTISLIHLVHSKKNNLKKLYTFVSYHSIMSDLSVLRAKASCTILRRLTGCLHTKAPTISHYTCRSVSTTSVVFGTIFSRESAGCYETAIRPLYRRNHRTYTRVYYQVENQYRTMVASPLRNCRAAWLFEGEGLSLLSFAAFRSSSRRDIVIIGVYIVAHESIRTLWKFYQ